MKETEFLELAIKIALEAHKGQVDKSGLPYILHPLHIMDKMETIELKIIAVLHDIIEDSDYTLSQLQQLGFSAPILSALSCLTKRRYEDYQTYITRVISCKNAIIVKLADMEHNSQILRLSFFSEKDSKRAAKYVAAYPKLKEALAKF